KEYNFSSYIISAIKVNFKELKFYNLMILIWLIIYILNYKNADSVYGGIEFSINPELIYLTFINQIICAFPLGAFRKGYYYFDPSFDRVLPAIFLFISFFFAIKFFLKKIELSKKTSATFLIIGIALSVFPTLMISFSNFYQNLLLNDENPQTFVQIYLQYIGMGILMLVFFNYVIKNSKKYRSYFMQKLLINLLAFLISAVVAIVHIINYSTFEKKNFLINNLEIVIKAINNGIMKEIPKNILSKNINEVPNKYHRFDYWRGLEYNPQTKLYEINKFNKDEMILVDNINAFHGSLFYQYHTTSYFEVFGIYANENAKKITEIGIDYKNHFYIENGDNLNNESLVHNKFNLDGFVIFSKLQNIQILNRENNEFDMIFALDSPKIFIDKLYLFNFDKIITTLSKKFDSKIFYQNKDKYLQDLISSQDGILIELNGVFNLKQ
ncbi:MAG: hypothetical protein ACO26G_00135, partial [Rickettsiales bacterium]